MTTPQLFRIAWARWRLISHINGDYIGRVLITGFYFTVFALFALGAQAFVDPLKLKRPKGWQPRPESGNSLEQARSQF
jgi:hypothetical protein